MRRTRVVSSDETLEALGGGKYFVSRLLHSRRLNYSYMSRVIGLFCFTTRLGGGGLLDSKYFSRIHDSLSSDREKKIISSR